MHFFSCKHKGVVEDVVATVRDLTKPLPKPSKNEKVVIKPVSKDKLRDVGKILVVRWRGFIKSPESAKKYLAPHLSAGVEQPFIAYLGKKPVGWGSPTLDTESKVEILDGGVHVLPQHRRQRIGTALLPTALQWLENKGTKNATVNPFKSEGEDATQRAITFYISAGRTVSE